MNIVETELPGVLIVEPDVFGDHRGFFIETWHDDRYREHGIDGDFVQDNLSRSRRGTLRGLHYQIQYPQGKLVQVLRGEIFDVAVDIRQGSSTFGKWVGVTLSEDDHRQFYVPRGLAHGFYVTSEVADVFYKCTDIYHPEHERTLLWNDPAIGVQWPLDGEPLLSDKDRDGQLLSEAEVFVAAS